MRYGDVFTGSLKKSIHSGKFQNSHKKGIHTFTRNRKLPFPLVFTMILRLVKNSLGIECELLEPDPSKIPPSKQAFSKARYNIRHTGFQELLELSIQQIYRNTPKYGTWKGYRVIGADGSSLRLPDSESVLAEFVRYGANGTNEIMPPIGRVSLFVDLCTSIICSARLASWNVGETTLAEEQLVEVVEKIRPLKQEKLLFVYDRGYASVKFIKQHRSLNADFLFRLQRGFYKKLWERVDAGETDFDFVIKTKDKEEGQKVRVVALHLNSGEIEVLITSLFDRKTFTLDDVLKLYTLRWHLEECYKRLKVGAEMENFSGIHLECVLQEFWAHLLMCNTLSLFMCDEQGPWDPERISGYRLNFSVLFGVMRRHLQEVIVGKSSGRRFGRLFRRAASRAKVKVRPGRSYSREKVDKPKRYHVHRRVC
jgi:hypothetical protein